MTLATTTPSRSVARPVANLGNTCFMNAILQALAHAPELLLAMDCESHRAVCPVFAENAMKRRQVASTTTMEQRHNNNDSFDHTATTTAKKQQQQGTRKSKRKTTTTNSSPDNGDTSSSASDIQYCVLCEVENHIEKVHDMSKRDKPVAPSTFVDGFVDHVAPWFQLGVQEDSHEFLRLLIDAMQKSCQRARVAQENSQDNVGTRGSTNENDPQDDEEYPFSLFRGTVESIVTCDSCGASSSTRDPIEDVGLEVTTPQPMPLFNERYSSRSNSSRTTSPTPNNNAPLWDVKTAFQRYASTEELDSGYKCEKCGKLGRATKQSRLANIPPILTLHLKRFRYGDRPTPALTRRSGRSSELNQLLLGSGDALGGKSGSTKIEGHVKFDLFFDLSPYMVTTEKKSSNMFCRLFAVIVHAGKNSHSGHYIAFVRDVSKNEWNKMDDSRVTAVSQEEVLNAEAYMLFYRLVNHPFIQRFSERKQQNSSSTTTEQSQASSTTELSSSSSSLSTKKRSPEVYATGEEWARKVNFPPHLIGVVQKISELIADDIRSSSHYQALEVEGTTTIETETYKRKLCELFYKLRNHPEAAETVLSSLGGSVEELPPTMEAGLL